MIKSLFIIILFPFFLSAGTVRMINNSRYDLRAVIRGADGTYLSENVIKSQKETIWTDTYGNYGMNGGANEGVNQNYRSRTPYTVLWYCLAGESYGINDSVSTGAVVTAQSSIGNRMCSAQKREKYPASEPEGNYLYTPPPLNQ